MDLTLEGIAESLLTRAAVEAPVDALDLAERLGLEVAYSEVGEPVVLGQTIFVPRRARIALLQWLTAHELGHWAAQQAGEDGPCERAANYLAGALLLPRATLLRQLRAGWDLDKLRRQHPNAPAHAIAVRIVQLRDAVAAVYDQGRLRRRWGPPMPLERELAAKALDAGAPVRVDDLTGAWPIVDGHWRRVIVLGSAAHDGHPSNLRAHPRW